MAGKKGRPAGFKMPEEHRTKIANSKIFNRLVDHAEGKIEMTQTQVQVGLALMKKILPDLQSVSISGDPENPVKHEHDASPELKQVVSILSGIAARERAE